MSTNVRVSRLLARALLGLSVFAAAALGMLAISLDWQEARAGAQPDFIVTRTDDPVPNGCQPGDCSLREALLGLSGATPTPTASPTVTPSPTGSPTVSPSPTPVGQVINGDANCDGSATIADVMLILEHVGGVIGLPHPQSGCAPLDGGLPGESGADADCNGSIEPRDALRILLAQVGEDFAEPPAGCPLVGQPVNQAGVSGVTPRTIGFNIPGDGPHFIRPTTALPAIGQPNVTIDGYTEPGAVPNTGLFWEPGNAVIQIVLDGSLIPSGSPDGEFGLWVGASGATIRGLSIVNFGDEGIKTGTFPTSALIVGNYIGVLPNGTAAGNRVGISIRSSQAGNTVGAANAEGRNVISGNAEDGLHLWGGTAVGVRNNFIGTNPAGTAGVPNGGHGIHISGAAGSFIGSSEGAGNLVSGNGGDGIYSAETNNVVIAGNRVGTNAAGTAPVSNDGHGIHLAGGVSNTIGGNLASAANLASGNGGSGIALSQSASNTNVKANLVGIALDRVSPLGNSGHGVFLDSLAHDNTIGGEFNVNEQNIIAFNGQAGVALSASAGVNNYIDPSRTYSNSGLGTDLLADNQVLANDTGTGNTTCPTGPDCDTGPNSLMNYPVVTSATYDGSTLTVQASLTAQPDFYNIFVFLNDECDPSGYGEGQRFISPSIGIQLASPGTQAFTRNYPGIELGGAMYVTMSASDPESTSEFSQCEPIQFTD